MMRIDVEHLFQQIDPDGSGFITRQEFEECSGLSQLVNMGIDKDVLKNAFDILDSNEDGKLEMKEFIEIFKCLHPPSSQDVLAIHSRIDRIADLVGAGRHVTAVLEKERKRNEIKARKAGQMLDPGALSNGAARRAESPPVNAEDEDHVQILQRLGTLGSQLGLLQRAAENIDLLTLASWPACSLTSIAVNSGTSAREDVGRPWALAALGPALRMLTAQLYALRAECKAAGLQYDGALTDDNVSTSDLITEVVKRITSSSCTINKELRLASGDLNGNGMGEQVPQVPWTYPPWTYPDDESQGTLPTSAHAAELARQPPRRTPSGASSPRSQSRSLSEGCPSREDEYVDL